MNKEEKLVGYNTDLLYFWDPEYGWIHYKDSEKMEKAYERFLAERGELKNG